MIDNIPECWKPAFSKGSWAPGDYPFPSNKYVHNIIIYKIKHILIRYILYIK